MDPNSHMGPVVSKEQLATVENYVKLGKQEGAEVDHRREARRSEGI